METHEKKIKLGILLSGGGRTMVNIAQAIQRGELPAEITTVISSRSTVAGVDRARQLGLEPHIIRVKDYPDVGEFSRRIIEIFDNAAIDLVLQCGWLCYWKIPPHYENKVMNIHPSLLPKYGGPGMWGRHVHEAVIAAGETESGCTVHFVTNEYDAGPIIIQRTCPVLPDDNAETLAARVFAQECLAYPQAILLYVQNRLQVKDGKVFIKK